MTIHLNKPALLIGAAGLTLISAWAIAAPAAPARYHVKTISRSWQGSERGELKPAGVSRQEVWVDGKRQRVDRPTKGFNILNDGRGDQIDWLYNPQKKMAELAHPTLSNHFAKTVDRSAWPAGWRPMPKATAVPPLHRVIPHELRRAGMEVKKLGETTRLGRRCAIYSVIGYGQRLKASWRERVYELAGSGKPLPKAVFERDPNRYTEMRAAATVAEGIVLWSETFSHNGEALDPSRRWSRNITVVELLETGKSYPITTFQVPPGTTCMLNAGISAPIPPGAKVVTVQGNGISRMPARPAGLRVPSR